MKIVLNGKYPLLRAFFLLLSGVVCIATDVTQNLGQAQYMAGFFGVVLLLIGLGALRGKQALLIHENHLEVRFDKMNFASAKVQNPISNITAIKYCPATIEHTRESHNNTLNASHLDRSTTITTYEKISVTRIFLALTDEMKEYEMEDDENPWFDIQSKTKIEAELLGPFKSPKKYVNRDSIFKESGIYIWTIEWYGGFLTNYVGETGTSFADRLLAHRRAYYTGDYRVYDKEEFLKSNRKIIWGGLWWFRKTISDEKLLEQIKAYMEKGKGKYDNEIEELLDSFQVFLIPLTYPNGLSPKTKENRRIRQRIEGALVRKLASDPDVFHFHDFTGEFTDKNEDDEDIQLHLKKATKIIGLEENMHF